MITVDPEKMRELAAAIFTAKGMPEKDAEEVADCLVDAHMIGRESHGLLRIPCYVRRLEQGGANPVPKMRIVSETPTTAVLDADHAMGMVTGNYAARLTREKALETARCSSISIQQYPRDCSLGKIISTPPGGVS